MKEQQYITVGQCHIDPAADICPGAVVGKPFRRFLDGTQEKADSTTSIKAGAYVGYYTIVGGGSEISSGVIIDDYCVIESRVVIGERSLITYRAQLCNDAVVGRDCVIGGFVAERTVIEDGCRVFGKIIHSHRDPSLGWDNDDAMEQSAKICKETFVGFDALIVGPVTVGPKAYVCAGTIITRNVPARCVATGVNTIMPIEQWRGNLSSSTFFR